MKFEKAGNTGLNECFTREKIMKYIISAVIASVLLALSPAYAGGCGKGDHAHNLQEMASKYFNQMDANGASFRGSAPYPNKRI